MSLLHTTRPRRTSVRPAALVTAAAVIGAAFTAVPAAAAPDGAAPAADQVTIDVLGITDFHGRLEMAGQSAGAARLATAVAGERAKNPNSIFVSSGDNVGATTFVSASQQDKPTLDVLNAMGLQVSAVGNHELDQGADDLSGRIDEASNFPYVAANLDGLANTVDSTVVTTDSDVRVGFIGVTTPLLPELVSPTGIAGVTVGPMLDAVKAEADRLEAGDHADVVVVLAHEGPSSTEVTAMSDSSAYAAFVQGLRADPNVDAVMGGHTHIAYTHQLAPAFAATQAGQYGEVLSKLSFTYDRTTESVTAVAAENIDLVAGDGKSALAEDPSVKAIVDDAVAKAESVGARPVGTITADLRRAVQANGTAENRGGESTITNLVADAQLAAVADLDVDIALMNPGGVRADLLFAGDTTTNPENTDGVVTFEEASAVQPFANTLQTFRLTGAQLREALEQQWQPDGASRPFLKLGTSKNLTYTYDPAAARGHHIGEIRVDGALVTDAATFTVVANSFLAGGGDNFTVLEKGTERADSGRVDLNAMVDEFEKDVAIAPDPVQRAVGVRVPALVPGTPAAVEVSSLAFSAAPGLAGSTVTVSLGDQAIGTATLDTAPTEANDETGRATVNVTVPAGTSTGPVTLRISDGVTSVDVAATITAQRAPVPEDFLWYFGSALSGDPKAGATPLIFGSGGPAIAFVGDWDGDGVDTPGYRIGNLYTLTNSLTTGETATTFAYGRVSDIPLVGDWDGDGKDTIAVRRGNINHAKNTLEGGKADVEWAYGRATDIPLVGDWDGDRKDTVSVRRVTTVHVNNTLAGGAAQSEFAYGRPLDLPLVGDWDNDGKDTLAVRRGAEVHVRNTLTGGVADATTTFGGELNQVVPGRFAAGAADTLAVVTTPLAED